MWLRRTISRLRYVLSQHLHPDYDEDYHKKVGMIKSLDVRLMADPRNPSIYTTPMQTLWPSISLYTQQLAWINQLLQQGQEIPLQWCRIQPKSTTLANFTVHQGQHIDVVETLGVLQKLTLAFLLLRRQENQRAGPFADYHTRVLQGFEDHLVELIRYLLHYTHHVQTQRKEVVQNR